MKRRGPWLVFAAALAIVIAVMASITATIVGFERQRMQAELRGAHQEQVRLALWRLDSETTPLLMEEIASLGSLGDPAAEANLPAMPEHVRARFVWDPVASTIRLVGETPEARRERLAALLAMQPLLPELAEPTVTDGQAPLDNPVKRAGTPVVDGLKTKGTYSAAEQRAFNQDQLELRIEAVRDNFEGYGNSLSSTLQALPHRASRLMGAVRPMWIGEELILLRRVRTGETESIHGAWLDWPVLRTRLLEAIETALPDATLRAVDDSADELDELLATLPVRLAPGPPNVELEVGASVVPSLALGWAGVLAAIVAVFGVLRWSMALSERRALFVSTVTHELRTPLTTFQMYTEMLDEGLVSGDKRSEYIATLRREASRLGALVENVLAYARIESDRAPLAPQPVALDELLLPMQARLQQRAEAADKQLAWSVGESMAGKAVLADAGAVEQILFNLVDNAAKYGDGDDPSIEIGAAERGTAVAIWVRDFGPGVASAEQREIFEPFAKALPDQAGTKPGVGLGLALCRRLARQLGGELSCEDARPGARFVLTLPRPR